MLKLRSQTQLGSSAEEYFIDCSNFNETEGIHSWALYSFFSVVNLMITVSSFEGIVSLKDSTDLSSFSILTYCYVFFVSAPHQISCFILSLSYGLIGYAKESST